MGCYADSVDDFHIEAHDGQSVARGKTAYGCVQAYLNGELTGHRKPNESGKVSFILPGLGKMDIVFLLAVDATDAETDFWADAFPVAAANGNRIRVRLPESHTYVPGDELRIYVGDEGSESADTLVHSEKLFPSGKRPSGWGVTWGRIWGHGESGTGWGVNWGHEWGFGCRLIEWKSAPKPPGDYPVKVVVVDTNGNESTAVEDTITLNTYARPATGLTVESYDSGTDALEFAWTESEDI